jgi:hypothetical protein
MHNAIYQFWKTQSHLDTGLFGKFSPLHTCVMSIACAPITMIQFENQETVCVQMYFSIPCFVLYY